MKPLRISDNRRFLVYEDGTPFFYLGDTAWELFHRLNRKDACYYLDDRAKKGFTVIQAVALAELDGHSDPNPEGNLPFHDLDPTRPNEAYWQHVDFIVAQANQRKLYVGFLPTWGRYWRDANPLFTPDNAETYGQWLGTRYKNASLIWILGGDRPMENRVHHEIMQRMALGLRKGDGGTHLRTFHPPGGCGSAQWLHQEPWLDFNMRQNGHQAEFTGRYDATRTDYDRTPTKPVMDAEPLYEDHPVSFDANRRGHSIAAEVLRPLFGDLFTGAFGHTYGHHSVWQMWSEGKHPINNPLMSWRDALQQPGAGQMQYGRRLIESRPFLTRIPDQSLIVPHRVTTHLPGAGRYFFAATRDTDETYAMVYAPVSRPFTVRARAVRGQRMQAWWYNPRTGVATDLGTHPTNTAQTFTPPTPGEETDWVLVLDDTAQNYPHPGV